MYYSKPGALGDAVVGTFAMIEIICWVLVAACESLHIINWTIFISQKKLLKLDLNDWQPDSDDEDVERLKELCSTDNVNLVMLSQEEWEAKYKN